MEPYDVIVNQPVVIDNVSEFALLIGDFAKEDLDNRMNHHRPGENFFHLTLSSVCVFAGFRHRESWFRWRPSAQMHFPQLVSGRSASNRRKILDDITRKSFSFCFQLFFNTFFDYHCSMGRPKHVRIMAGALEGDLFVGPKAEDHRGLLSIRYPMEHGIVNDWNDMERIWTHIYSKVSWKTVKFDDWCKLLPSRIQCC
jgi:hypothetical protein